ncbi:hypothetical protein MPER_14534, partial [Moniliophthora perniciosa FA553]
MPLSLRNPILDLASSHLICSVALTGILGLQAGRLWAETADDDAEASIYEPDTDYKTSPSD